MAAAARRGDPGLFHCSPWKIASGSSDVLINGRGAARIGDSTSLHLKPGKICFPHTSKISQGAATVFINRRPAARRGSAVALCTKVIGGSGDVDIGGPSVGGGSGFGFQVLAFALSFVDVAEVAGIGGPVLDIEAPIDLADDLVVIDI